MLGLVAMVALALSPEVAAQREVALAVAAIQPYAEQRQLTRFCLAHDSEDPGAPLLASLRKLKLEPTPASGCSGKNATGMLLDYSTSKGKSGVFSVTMDILNLPDRQRLGHCSFTFTWRSGAWEAGDDTFCNGY